MSKLAELLAKGRRDEAHRPWPRAGVDAQIWREAAFGLRDGDWSLLGLWGDGGAVEMALVDEATGGVGVVSLACPQGRFPSVGLLHPPAIRLERTIRDLFGLVPEDAPDERPWLDHGRWGVARPLSTMPSDVAESAYPFLPAEGEGLHQVAVGPVHAGIIEPGHFRFTAAGETVVRLEERFGYVHKGIEGLMAGADLFDGAKLAGRVSGDSTVAYAFGFARAAEAAWSVEVPQRAQWLRALMAELERLANHLGDIGAICNDAAFAMMLAHCGVLRELVLRAADEAFGHRLMRDCIVPGGAVGDLDAARMNAFRQLVNALRRRFPALIALYDNTASLLDRTVGTGIVAGKLARQFAAGGFIGRAAGRSFDARRRPGYTPYDSLHFDVPVRSEGDVDARLWIRIGEVEQSLSLIEQILDSLPAGPIRIALPESAPNVATGLALVEGFRGDILISLRLDRRGKIERCHLRDPSWFQWPLLEAAIEGNIIADFPLCNKSFNCSYSGHDL